MAAHAAAASAAQDDPDLPDAPPLVRLRERRGISKDDLIASTGFSRTYLSHVEYGDRDLSKYATLARLAEGYGITVERLVKFIDETVRWRAAHVQRVHVPVWHVKSQNAKSGRVARRKPASGGKAVRL